MKVHSLEHKRSTELTLHDRTVRKRLRNKREEPTLRLVQGPEMQLSTHKALGSIPRTTKTNKETSLCSMSRKSQGKKGKKEKGQKKDEKQI